MGLSFKFNYTILYEMNVKAKAQIKDFLWTGMLWGYECHPFISNKFNALESALQTGRYQSSSYLLGKN